MAALSSPRRPNHPRSERKMQIVYLVLAIVGAVVPYLFLAQHVAVAGLEPSLLFQAIVANDVTTAMSADLMLSSLVFWIFMFSRPAAPRPWLFIALNLVVGLSCALPAYLFADTRLRAF
jgi:hypothetical protein